MQMSGAVRWEHSWTPLESRGGLSRFRTLESIAQTFANNAPIGLFPKHPRDGPNRRVDAADASADAATLGVRTSVEIWRVAEALSDDDDDAVPCARVLSFGTCREDRDALCLRWRARAPRRRRPSRTFSARRPPWKLRQKVTPRLLSNTEKTRAPPSLPPSFSLSLSLSLSLWETFSLSREQARARLGDARLEGLRAL